MANVPRRDDAACPSCHAQALAGDVWNCGQCGNRFDIFAQQGVCPNCGKRFPEIPCIDCGKGHALAEWHGMDSEQARFDERDDEFRP
jgi:hypothetical protein